MFKSSKIVVSRENYINLIKKSICINCIRTKSSLQPNKKIYSHTVLFPKTDFPIRSNNAAKLEIQKVAQFSKLYEWQQDHLKGREFVLHDGPPYANGDLHMGHAVNKIVKDINNRSQVLQGNRVHYIPGWDCHGLPIELKALQQGKKSPKNKISDPVRIRQIARKFAKDTVEKQKEAFKSWGVMADWDKQCYLTINNGYVQKQLHQFYRMYTSGLIFRALKPVYWSPSSRTALAEAELEYDAQYKSKEVYVKFPVENLSELIQNAAGSKPVSALVWTTTPWTLVANKAICYGPQMKYSLVEISGMTNELFLLGSGLIDGLQRILGMEIKKILEFNADHLTGTLYRNKLLNKTFPFLRADHVTEGKGTGLVHTAPAHGPEDFLVGLQNNITMECNVDESGCYTNLSPDLNGLPVLAEGQDKVIEYLQDSIIYQGVYVHSYPLDWRTKKPVILRASQQWFIDTAALKEKALNALENITILPTSTADQYRQGFRAQLQKRPYWCISRQRAWGVPIPVLYSEDQVIVDERIIRNLCSLMDHKGPDIWWTSDVRELLSDDIIKEYELQGKEVVKGKDIMDIWLDSGLSWQTLEGKKAQLYSEGVDQLTGWFQASLLTSLALKNEAPYESIFVHGFVVDDNKRKMSKSIGNVIDPTTIIHGGKDKNSQPAYGVDTLRWWVASHATQHTQIVISKKLLDDCQTEVVRLRNIMKYLLGVISDMDKTDFDKTPQLVYFDQYMVNETHDFLKQIYEHYNSFRYNHVAQTILFFISNKVSALYCHCIKDRIYCSQKVSNERLSAQLVANTILISLCKAIGPILPHLVEEVWHYHPLCDKPIYFTDNLPILSLKPVDVSIMDAILELKKIMCSVVKNEDLKKFTANLKLESELLSKLKCFDAGQLCELFELSAVSLEEIQNGGLSPVVDIKESDMDQCLRCRKYNALQNSDRCLRCENVLASR